MLEIECSKHGAELTSIKLDGNEKLHQPDSYWGRHAPILFPIVGKLKDNKTKINGNTYEMTQHGFARDMDFEELEKNSKYVLKSNEETLSKFPFKFELYVEYDIKQNKLTTKYTVINKDDKEMLFGLGGHPAFICDYSLEKYELEFNQKEDKIEFYKLQDGLLKTSPIDSILDNNKIKLTKNIFDEDAIIMKNLNSNIIRLKNIETKETMLEFDFEGFPYLAIWSKKGAPFVCIEPWQNHTDTVDSDGRFKSKPNILKLKPNERFSCNYKVELF